MNKKKISLLSVIVLLFGVLSPVITSYAEEMNQQLNERAINSLGVDNLEDVDNINIISLNKDELFDISMLNDDTLSVSEIEMQKVNSELNDLGSIRTIEAYKTDDPSNITKVAVARAGSQVVVTDNYVLQTPGINLRNVDFSSMSDEEKIEYIKQNSNTFAGKIENGKLSETDYNVTLNDTYAVATINGTDVSNNIEFINYEVAEENSQVESRSAKAIPLPNTQERINGAAHGGDTERAINYAQYNFEYLKEKATETVVATNYDEFKTGLSKSGVIAIDVQGEIVFPAIETNTGANSQIVIYSSNGLGSFNTSQNPFGFGDSPSRAINVVGTSELYISNIKWIGRRGAEDWKNNWYTNVGKSTGLFDVDAGGTLNIYPGFEAKNHDSQGTNTSYVGWWGGLYRLEGSGSSVNIYGADIQNNSGSVGTIGLMNLAGSTTNIFDMNAQHNLGGWEGLFDVRDGLSGTMNFYGGHFSENFGECRNRNSLYGYSWAVNKPSWGGKDQVNYYGDAVFENNWLIGNTIDSDGMYTKLQKSNAGTMHDSNAATQEKTANAQIFYNLTKDSNISVGGTTWNQNIDNTYNSLKGKYGGIPMGKIAYTDPGLQHLADNPDIRGVKSDLYDGNKVNTITSLGKYVPIKKKVNNQWYLVLTRSYTEVEVKAVDSNGNSIENGKYDYTNYIQSNTETRLPISQIEKKYPVSIELQSNVQISGDMTSANDPTTFPQTPNKEDTEFTIKDNNNLSGNEDCIYKTTILVKYEDVKYYEVLANDASILSTNAQIAAGDINNKLIEWMDANIKELNTNTTLNDPSKIVVESASIDNIKAGTPGAYEVTFKFADAPTVSKTVLLTIVDDSDVNLDILGINAFVTKNVAKTLTTDELIKQYMEVSAVYEGIEDISDELIVEYQPGDFEKIKGGVIGDYTITFRINNHETGMGAISAVNVLGLHVVENEYTVSTDKQLIYEAHNLMMTVSEAQKFKKGNSYNMVQLLDKFEIKSKFIDKNGAVLNTWGADNGNEIGNGRPKETKDAVLSIDAVSYDNFAKNNDDDRVALSPWEIKFIINTHNSNVSGPGRGTEFNSLLTIRPDSSSPTDDNKAYIDAKDVTINKDDVDAQLPNNIDDLKTIMQMVAKDDAGNDKSNDAEVSLANPNQETDLFAHEIGTYQVVFRLDVGASVTRTLTIIDNNTTCDEDSGVCIVAQDFDIELSEILTDPTITENEIKTLAQVKAWSMIDGSDKFGDVVLDAEDYTTITSQTTAGTVSGVTFSIPDTSATKDVTATIVDNVTYTINANNFAVSVKDAASLTADLVKSANHANVSVSPFGDVADVTVDSAQLGVIQNAVVGQYPLTFTYKSVTKEIKVNVYDDNTNTDNDADKDQAQIFLTADSQVKLRTNNSRNNPTLKTVDEFNRDIVAGTNAKAWLLDGRVAQVIEFPGSEEVLDQPGLYIVKLVGASYNYETSVKDVYVSVVDDNTNCNGEVCIAAQPIEILLSEASIYNEAMAKDRSKPIKAWYENKPDAITEDQIIADARDIAIVNEQTTEIVLANGQKFQVQDAKPLTTGVNVTITEDKVGSFVIEASNNIVLSSDEAKNATSEQLRDKAGITITNENGVDVTAAMIGKAVANTTQLTAINTGVAQAYPLKFELNGSESNEIQVSVYDDNTATDTEDKEEANVFLTAVTPKQINVDEVNDYINNGWRTTHEVKAWAKDGTDLTASVSASGLDTVKEEAGSYTLTLSVTQAGHTATKDVVVNVVDNDTTTNTEKYLKASNFELTTDWLSTNELTEAIAKTNANVKAWDSNGADLTANVTAKAEHLAKINEGKPGAFPLEFSVDGLSKQVVVSVKDNNTTCVDNVCITAKGFRKVIPANLTDESAKEDAEAHAWYTDSLETPTISVNQTQLSAINDATKPIVLPLTFTADNKADATVAVTLTDENTVVDETIKEMISAHDFDATLEELASLDQSQTEALFKERSEVVAYPVIDGVVQIDPLTVTMTTTKPTTVGRHAVTFTTDKGTTKTVYVNVTDENTQCFGNVCISASDFDWQFTKRTELDQEATLTQSNAKAWYKDATTSPELTLSVEQDGLDAIHALSAAQATNPVVVKVSEDAKVTINVNVIDDNFTLTSKDAINLTRPTDFGDNNENITEDFIVGKFEATATNNQTQAAGTVKVSSDGLDLIKSTQQGVVNITLFVEEQPEITKNVIVNVVPEEATLGDSATIVAKDFSIKLSQVMGANSVTEDYLKGQAGPVNAWWNDGRVDAINIALNTAEFNAINNAEQAGVLPLTFYVVEDPTATITINVTIIDNTQITLPGNDGDLGTEDDVVVKPNPGQDGNYPEENPDGSVDLPNGGDITFPNNPDNNGTVTVPGGSTVNPDGTVETPEGGVVKPNPDGNIELPGNDGDINNKPDNPVIKPGGNGDATINPDGSVTPDDDSQITYPNNPNNPGGSTTVPGGSTVNPDGSVTLPGGDKPAIDTDEDGTITLPGQDDELGTDDDVAVKPDGGNTTVNPDGSVTPDNDSEITFPNNPGNDDITQIPGGSTVKPDGTVETPEGGVVKPNPDGGVELPGNDGKLPAPDNTDNPLIKPEGDGPIVVNPDGSVTLPDDENGNITYPNNPDNNGTVIVPGGSTVSPDGSVTLPGGDKPAIDTDEDGTLELPGLDGDLTKPEDNPVVKPENGNATINPDGSVTLPDDEKGEITFPNNPDNEDITQIPGGSTVKPDGTVELPDGGVVRPNPDGGVELPGNDGKLPAPDNTDNPVVKPEGDGPIVVNPDGSVTLPDDENGNITYPNNPDNNGTITIPGGSTVSPDGVVTTPEGGKVDTEEDGSIKVPGPNLNLGDEDDVVVKPGGNGDATINPDGSVTLPNGGTITPDNGNGQEWEVPNGTIVKPDGSIVLPGNNPNIDFEPTIRPNGDGSISVPGKDGVFDENGDNDHKVEGEGITFDPVTGDITMPNGGTVTRPGGEVVTVPNGTIVRPDGTIIQPAPEMNNVPVITIKDSADYTYDKDAKTITINQFTPFDVAQTATANDVEDGDLTNELVINVTRTRSRQTVNSNVDTSIAPSEWLVEYSVTDSKGATSRKEITVIVKKEAHAPVIEGTKDHTITVGDNLDLMAGVTATDYEGTDITADVTVKVTDPNGNVSNNINTMIVGTHTVEYSVTDKNGLTTTVTQTVTVKPIVLPGEDNKPGTDDDVNVTPNPDGDKPTTDGDGNVTLPGGGDVEFPGGGGVEVPDDSVITPGGEVIVPGADNKPGTDDDVVIKPIPPTDEKPNGGVELPGDDGDINTKPDNPVVTPQGPNKPVIKPDGGVELPDGGDVEYPNNPNNPGGSIVVPPGSVVNPDGTVETPDGGNVDTDEDGTITLPGQDGNLGTDDDVQIKPGGNGDVTIKPDGSVDLPNGGDITFPNNPDNNGTVTVPGGSTVAPDGTITTPEGGVVKPNPDGTVELPGQDGNLGTDDDVIVKPGGNGDVVVNPDGSVDLPNGGDVSFPNKPDAGMEVPGGSNVGQDGTVTAPNGDQSRPNVDGTITVPGHDGQFGTVDDGIIKPNGPNKPVLNPDGTITLPDGGDITFPGLSDCEIEILPGGYVASTGVVTNPGADGIINTADDEVLDPAVVCSIEVTEPQQPTKPEATHTGSESNMIMLFVTIAISSAVVLGLRRRK